MGYRSDVTIVLQGTKEDRKLFIARLKLEEKLTEDMTSWCKTEEEDTMTIFSFTNVKWYDMFKEVQAWEALFDCATDKVGIEFLRLGEEAEDVEHLLYGDNAEYYMYVNREVGFY